MKAKMNVHPVNKFLWFFSVFCQAVLILVLTAPCCPADIPVIRGERYNPLVINSEHLYGRKVIIQDLMADQKRIFTKSEKKRGFKDYYYVKFILRDSKLPCFICKYDYRDMDRFKEIRKGDRVTIAGRIERIGKGVKRFTNPKFVVKVDDIRKGWDLSEAEAVLEVVGDEEQVSYTDLNPADLSNLPEEHDGEYVRIRERFSIVSTFFSNFEKDLNLSNDTAIKFRGEFLPLPYYIQRDAGNRVLLSGLRTGDKITIFGKVRVRPIADGNLVLFSAHSVRKGWK